MSIALCVRQALPPASLYTTIALLAALTACGGGGMGMAPASTTTDVMGSGSMGSGSMSMSCMNMSMNMSMSCPAPTVTMVAPPGTVNRTVMLRAQVTMMQSDGMARVDFMVDGTRVGTASGETFGVSWDSTTVNDGAHTLTATVSDSLGQTGSASPVTIEVDNHPVFTVALSPAQVVPAPASAGSATAHLSVDLGTGAVSGSVTLSGVTATAVTLNAAFAGDSGPGLMSFSPGAGGNAWQVPAGALLTAEQVTALLQGALYLTAGTAAHPGGELRGQITPTNVMVNFSAMNGAQEVPAVTINAAGVVATTVDTVANTLTVHVHATGVADASAAGIDDGSAGSTGPQLAALVKDDIDPGHWSTQLAAVSGADIAAFKNDNWYVNVTTPADPQGAIRGQIELTGP
jgi:CHRD domain/Bacterial Ig domain